MRILSRTDTRLHTRVTFDQRSIGLMHRQQSVPQWSVNVLNIVYTAIQICSTDGGSVTPLGPGSQTNMVCACPTLCSMPMRDCTVSGTRPRMTAMPKPGVLGIDHGSDVELPPGCILPFRSHHSFTCQRQTKTGCCGGAEGWRNTARSG